jgi:DNA-binding helix-hairpin-helix protein with protein kinase domain
MRRSNFATVVYLLVVFVSGVVVGGFANRVVTAGPKPQAPPSRTELRKQYIQDMRTRLHLNDAQVNQLQQIADATGQQMHDMHKTIEDEHVQKVVAMLDDSQKAEYAKMRDEREKHRQEQAKK